jgi:hypothetical protein
MLLVHLGCHSGWPMRRRHHFPENGALVGMRRYGQQPIGTDTPTQAGVFRGNTVGNAVRSEAEIYALLMSKHRHGERHDTSEVSALCSSGQVISHPGKDRRRWSHTRDIEPCRSACRLWSGCHQ